MEAHIKTNWTNQSYGQEQSQSKPLLRSSNDAVPTSKYFGVDAHSKLIPSLNIFLRTGRMVSVPYVPPPVIDYNPQTGIHINHATNKIVIKGRHLDNLMRWLCSHRVVWIKESRTGYGLENDDIFVQDIKIEQD